MSLVDLGKRLLEAAKLGMTDEVRTLMSNGAPFTTDWLGNSPLHFAAQSGHIATGEVLLRAGISRDARTKVDRTPLHVSSQFGHADLVELLLRSGADIEAKDMLRMTPLHWAVEKTHVHIIQLLLAHGADINCQNKFDKTPVDIAFFNGRSDIADLLQMSRANPVEIRSDATIVEEVTTSETLIEPEVSSPIVSATPVRLLTQNAGLKIGTVIPKVEGVPRNTDASEGSTEQSSTAVLATLAALAEATAPINAASAPPNTTAAEALNWLEMHGITMISGGDNSTIVSSSIESGQTLTLTEAGKLALNQIVKQQAVQEEVEENEDTSEPTTATVVEEDGTQRVITIVGSEETQPKPTAGGPIVVAVRSTDEPGSDEPVVKKLKLCDQIVIKTEKLDQTELQRQLQVAQKQAEGYKLQLQRKEQEAENYKKQLTEITLNTKPTADSEQLSS